MAVVSYEERGTVGRVGSVRLRGLPRERCGLVSHPHQGLPATPREIQNVLRSLSQLVAFLTGEADNTPDVFTVAYEHGRLLAGMVAGFDGTVFPVPQGAMEGLGYRVAQSLAKGGTPWV
jgi:hypothetical protein